MIYCSVLELLLEHGGEIDSVGYRDGQTPLMKVARYIGDGEQIHCAQLLLNNGANINHQDKQGNTAVHLAVETENVKLMQYLVSKNPDMTITNRNGKTARELATTAIDVILSTTRDNRYDDVLELMDNAISESDRESMLVILQEVPVHEYKSELIKRAIALDHLAASELLLENGMNPNDLDVVQSPILMVLTQIPIENRIKYFDLLVKYGVDVNQLDSDGCHFFRHLITELKDTPSELLLRFTIHVLRSRQPNAVINMMHKDVFGKALFSYLWRLPGNAGYSIRTQFEFGRQLLDWRESTSDEEKSLLTTRGIHVMATNGQSEQLGDTITKYPGSVNSRNWKSQSSALHLAADGAQIDIVKTLIEIHAELDCLDCFHATALIRCFLPFSGSVAQGFNVTDTRGNRPYSSAHYKCANMLIDGGANVNLTDDTLNTPLHYAVLTVINDTDQNNYFNAINMVERLIQHGARKDSRNRQGQTALDIARSSTCPDNNLIACLND